MNSRVRVFSYGTLRPSLYPQMAERFALTSVGRAVLYGNYQMHDLGLFPALVKLEPKLGERQHPDGGAAIVGEVVELHNLEQTDRYEGYPSLYTRSEVQVIMDDGRAEHVWIYTFARPSDIANEKVVTSGDWAHRQ